MTIGPDLKKLYDERNQEIYELRTRSGLSYRKLAERFGLSHERVRQIVKREHMRKVFAEREQKA